MKATSIQAKATEALKKIVEVDRDTTVAQRKIAKARVIELEVMTFIKINKLKIDLFDVNKDVERLKEEKKSWKKSL